MRPLQSLSATMRETRRAPDRRFRLDVLHRAQREHRAGSRQVLQSDAPPMHRVAFRRGVRPALAGALCRGDEPGVLGTAGLLHNLGLLWLADAWPAETAVAFDEATSRGTDPRSAQRTACGSDCCANDGLLGARRGALPGELAVASARAKRPRSGGPIDGHDLAADSGSTHVSVRAALRRAVLRSPQRS